MNGETDWYGVLKQIFEFEYVGEEPVKRVVLFNYQWYDSRHPNGTHKHNHYKITKINHIKRYQHYDPFTIAQNTRQVYYLPYPRKCKSNWKVVIKDKLMV